MSAVFVHAHPLPLSQAAGRDETAVGAVSPPPHFFKWGMSQAPERRNIGPGRSSQVRHAIEKALGASVGEGSIGIRLVLVSVLSIKFPSQSILSERMSCVQICHPI